MSSKGTLLKAEHCSARKSTEPSGQSCEQNKNNKKRNTSYTHQPVSEVLTGLDYFLNDKKFHNVEKS